MAKRAVPLQMHAVATRGADRAHLRYDTPCIKGSACDLFRSIGRLGCSPCSSGPDNSVRLVLAGKIRAPGDTGFAVDGAYGESGWESENGELRIRIAPDGTVSGGGVAHPYRFRCGGKISKSEALVETDLELLQASDGGLPTGTRSNFYYVLQRPDPTLSIVTRVIAEKSPIDCRALQIHSAARAAWAAFRSACGSCRWTSVRPEMRREPVFEMRRGLLPNGARKEGARRKA
jgi:hypothetical protein